MSFSLALLLALGVCGCEQRKLQPPQSDGAKETSLVEIALKDSPKRVVKDALGNIVEIDFRGIPLSDQFVRLLLAPELKSLQKFSVSGEMITEQTMGRLSDPESFPPYREIVFEDTSIRNPEGHVWVTRYREIHRGTTLTFRQGASSPRDVAGSVQSTNLSSASGSDTPSVMAGTWHCRDQTILLELGRDGHWKWWDLTDPGRRFSEAPVLEGGWFVRKGVLFLFIERTKEPAERIGPGLALTFKVTSVSADALSLHQVRGNNDTKFRRIPEPGGPAEGDQPVRSGTNQTSGAADPHR